MKNQQTPFRIGGRGSKQLSKALEQSSVDRGRDEISWVFSAGRHPCFAKVLSFAMSGIMIQPMSPVEGDSNLYKLWEGHVWLEKREQIHPVQMKQEFGGWRVLYTTELRQIVDSTLKFSHKTTLFPPPELPRDTVQHGDLISLEESEFDTQSLDSSVSLLISPPLIENSILSTPSHSSSGELESGSSSPRPPEVERVVIDLVDVDSLPKIPPLSSYANLEGSEAQTIEDREEKEEEAKQEQEEEEEEGMMTPTPAVLYGSPAITLCDESPLGSTSVESETQSSLQSNPWKSKKRSRRRAEDVPVISLGIAFDASSEFPIPPTVSRVTRSSQSKRETRLPSRSKNNPRPVSCGPSSSRRTPRQTNYRQRDDFFGSWPTRNQSAASGTWSL